MASDCAACGVSQRLKSITKTAICTTALLALAAPAHAFFFFFIVPIPKGSANPDAMDATLEQRQNAMCAAYQFNAIDPTLSGKRESTWRGEVANSALKNTAGYKDFTELRNRYIRQWALQSKNSYQAGQSYGTMLMTSCTDAGLPYNIEQYNVWKQVLAEDPNTSFKNFKRDIQLANFDELFNNTNVPAIALSGAIGKTVAEVRVMPDGKPDYCQLSTEPKI